MATTAVVAAGACGPYAPRDLAYAPAGGLIVSQTSRLGNLSYPDVLIPNSQQGPIAEPPLNGESGWAPIVNPGLREGGGGFVLLVCNTSSRAHTVGAVQVSIARMTPYTEQLQTWQPCSGVYHPGESSVGGGCGGADFENEYLHAPFAADAQVGASVTATQTGTNGSDINGEVNLGPLPVTLKPGQAMTIEVGVTQPSAPGYYTYGFALTVDGASTGVVANSQTTLLAPVTHHWDGANCQSPAMQAEIAQMPTPTANGGFICP